MAHGQGNEGYRNSKDLLAGGQRGHLLYRDTGILELTGACPPPDP